MKSFITKCAILFLSLLVIFTSTRTFAAEAIQYEKLTTLSKTDIDRLLREYDMKELIPAKYDVDIYKVRFETKNHQGAPAVSSGLVAFPKVEKEAVPLVVYQHGTMTQRDCVPSRFGYQSRYPLAAFASGGYALAQSDYLGLGDSYEIIHPYCHADSLAFSGVEIMDVAKHLSKEMDIPLNDQLFISGYSEGGLGAMAMHHKIESEENVKASVTASAPLAGPYDLRTCSVQGCLKHPISSTTMYISYLLLAYNSIYGDIFETLADVMNTPYQHLTPKLFDGNQHPTTIRTVLPRNVHDLLKHEFIHKELTKADSQIAMRLEENSRYNWKAKAPVLLAGASGDKDVAFSNSERAYKEMKAAGSDIRLHDVGNDYDHMTGKSRCLISARQFFDQFKH